MLLLLQGREWSLWIADHWLKRFMTWAITSTLSLTIKHCCGKVPFLWSLFTCQQHKAQLCSELTILTLLSCKTEKKEHFWEKWQLLPRLCSANYHHLPTATRDFNQAWTSICIPWEKIFSSGILCFMRQRRCHHWTEWLSEKAVCPLFLKQQPCSSMVCVMRLPLAEQYFPMISLVFTCVSGRF